MLIESAQYHRMTFQTTMEESFKPPQLMAWWSFAEKQTSVTADECARYNEGLHVSSAGYSQSLMDEPMVLSVPMITESSSFDLQTTLVCSCEPSEPSELLCIP